jgi:hypothetical protein
VIHERWGLVNDGAFARFRRSVEPVRRADGTAAVLRFAPPEELDAAEWFSGHGAVRVLDIDRAHGALLLERALHLRELVPERDDEATAAVAAIMRSLWRPPEADCPFPTVRHWGRFLEPGSRAAGIYLELALTLCAMWPGPTAAGFGSGWRSVVVCTRYARSIDHACAVDRAIRNQLHTAATRRPKCPPFARAMNRPVAGQRTGRSPGLRTGRARHYTSFWLAVADVLERLTRER